MVSKIQVSVASVEKNSFREKREGILFLFWSLIVRSFQHLLLLLPARATEFFGTALSWAVEEAT